MSDHTQEEPYPRFAPNEPKHCRSCGAPIVWRVNRATGKRMPIDYAPNPDGNIFVQDLETYVMAGKPGPYGTPAEWRHTSHFVTCPQRREWRKKDE